mmetsp:Transcript_24924/g.59182  ORF Transcript_24924/g.59182 Transcript_24924/m.59182 type:complete len:275 (-) Transcript_24924:59-883(-)
MDNAVSHRSGFNLTKTDDKILSFNSFFTLQYKRTSSYNASRSEENLRRPEEWSGSKHGSNSNASCISRYPLTPFIKSNPRSQMAPYFNKSSLICSLLLAKYSAPNLLSSSDARISKGQCGILAASFCASTTSMSSELHLVNGHSHIPLKSGLDMSDAINSSGSSPGRSSHSGSHPAPGVSRTGVADSVVSGLSSVDEQRDVFVAFVVVVLWEAGVNADDVSILAAANAAATKKPTRACLEKIIFVSGFGCCCCCCCRCLMHKWWVARNRTELRC